MRCNYNGIINKELSLKKVIVLFIYTGLQGHINSFHISCPVVPSIHLFMLAVAAVHPEVKIKDIPFVEVKPAHYSYTKMNK